MLRNTHSPHASAYALYQPTHGTTRRGRPRLNYVDYRTSRGWLERRPTNSWTCHETVRWPRERERDLRHMSSDFANFWHKRSSGNSKQTHMHSPSHVVFFHVCTIPYKNSNDFYGVQYSVKYEVFEKKFQLSIRQQYYQVTLTVICEKIVHIIKANIRSRLYSTLLI